MQLIQLSSLIFIEQFVFIGLKTRPDMGAGCEERFDLQFFKWIWEYPNAKRPTILKGLEQLPEEKKVIVLKSPNEVRKFLEHI